VWRLSTAREPALTQSKFLVLVLHYRSQCGLTISLAKIDVGIAYAIWAAIGTATVTIAGMLLFSEGVDSIKIASLSLIIMGVVGLNLRVDP
jgi:small multidrug resistance pump